MMHVLINEPDGTVREIQVGDDCVVGKDAKNEIQLSGWRVAKDHARLFRTPSGVLVEDMGAFGGVTVNGERIDIQHGPLKASDVIGVGPYKLRVKGESEGAKPTRPEAQPDTTAQVRRHAQAAEILQASHDHARRVQSEILRTREAEGRPVALIAPSPVRMELALVPDQVQREAEFEWRKRIHGLLLETMDLRRQDVSRMTDERLRQETESLIRTLLKDCDREIPAGIDRQLLCRQVLNEAVGLGPLEELLADDQVTEIMVNRYNEIFVERAGKLQRHPLTFTGDRAVMGVIERIVAPLGRRIDESSPMVDARLKDGSRVNAIIPPLALKGPTLTIRKFSKRKLAVSDLVSYGSISPDMAKFLQICVEGRKNMVVSGGTGSGKTTLLNILSNFIPSGERVITVEDAAELQLNHEHLISLESRPPNVEGKGGVPIRDLVKNTLRMRPDRIVVGECRGAEALDMLQAMNTGHEGSLTTLHANTPRDGLARLETMVLMAGMELPLVAIREQISSAVDIIVQQTRFSCGTRMVTHIAEITGMESGTIQIQDLFKFVNRGYDPNTGKVRGYFTGCDMAPCFYEELLASGQSLDLNIFKPTVPNAGFRASTHDEMDEELL
ncbi:ATPase, T2SS/T4P/T4SS family [Aquabacterium sp.]|uniref:ATPase, T2SS/T4P/T4SS family n=1 Tax=Aquabacterium sp. TaxID=1872578 RepID=UPI0024899295|nr:ATPase, T2SS/T4P/T4SS family [Aquabacterium sp.]MDI1260155.1 ATPase, T2SS/T4P/T4SS family [Aquabacterium sp.]